MCRHPPVVGSQESRVQASASSHTIGVLTHAPVAGSHASAVQGSPSAHFGVPWQIGLALDGIWTQVSPVVQGSPSLQAVPAATGVKTQPPVAGLHVSVVQGLPSSQERVVKVQAPVAGSQASVVQGLPSLHATGVPQTPLWQMLPTVQGLASSHCCPSGAGVEWHWPLAGSQASRVQGLPSSQSALVVQTSVGRTLTPIPGSLRQMTRSVASSVRTA